MKREKWLDTYNLLSKKTEENNPNLYFAAILFLFVFFFFLLLLLIFLPAFLLLSQAVTLKRVLDKSLSLGKLPVRPLIVRKWVHDRKSEESNRTITITLFWDFRWSVASANVRKSMEVTARYCFFMDSVYMRLIVLFSTCEKIMSYWSHTTLDFSNKLKQNLTLHKCKKIFLSNLYVKGKSKVS